MPEIWNLKPDTSKSFDTRAFVNRAGFTLYDTRFIRCATREKESCETWRDGAHEFFGSVPECVPSHS